MSRKIALSAIDARRQEAKDWASQFQLSFIEPNEREQYDYCLYFNEDKVELIPHPSSQFSALHINFTEGKLKNRIEQGSKKNEPLIRACLLKNKKEVHIIDATAGLGTDGFILASTGARVTLLEKSPILFLLLKDALVRAHRSGERYKKISSNLDLRCEDSEVFFNHLRQDQYPDVTYLDPMFPTKSKTALVKKNMQILQSLFMEGDGTEGTLEDKSLLESVLCHTKYRVVVKRPVWASPLNNLEPNFSLGSGQVRFDVYNLQV